MKVYFTASISQKDQFSDTYKSIVAIASNHGHDVQHSHITETRMSDLSGRDQQQSTEYYKKFLQWLNKSDLVIVEASFPSTLNIGHEITIALEKGKPVIVLFKKGYGSLFLEGLQADRLLLVEYTDKNLEQVLVDALEYAKDTADTRSNFFVSPNHISYLDWIAKNKKVPRSVYLRELIEKDMEANEEYQNS